MGCSPVRSAGWSLHPNMSLGPFCASRVPQDEQRLPPLSVLVEHGGWVLQPVLLALSLGQVG